jgi:hypothetical protein
MPCRWTIGVLGFDSRRELGIFLFTIASRPALGPTQPPIQWVLGALSPGVKQPGLQAHHLPPSSSEAKECVELYLHSSNMSSWRGAQLKKKAQGQLYLYLLPVDIPSCPFQKVAVPSVYLTDIPSTSLSTKLHQ